MQAAETLWRQGQHPEAHAAFEQIAHVFAAQPEPCMDLGWLSLADAEPAAAHYWFSEALHRGPDNLRAHLGAGEALLQMGQPDDALNHYHAARPRAEAYYGEGEALLQLGDIEAATHAFSHAAAQAPGSTRYHYALAQCGRFSEGDPRLPPLKDLEKQIDRMSPYDQVLLHFTLAKAADDMGRTEEAIGHWQEGNHVARNITPYDEEATLGQTQDVLETFTADLMAQRAGAGHDSDIPVFIVGMPRSGTTLVEQILASHPQVFGAGETMYLPHLVAADLAGADFPTGVANLSDSDLKRLGGFYLARLETELPQDMKTHPRRITDKLPVNYLLAGLIRLILPNARIIHVVREAMDTCFSCYTHLFSQNIDYAYDQRELGRYYHAYAGLMAHWRSVLPANRFMEVRYEDLVMSPEREARRMLEFCDLPWDPICLHFPETHRVVHTLSARDVRRPLYRTAIGHAKLYQSWLEPLRTALEETNTQDSI